MKVTDPSGQTWRVTRRWVPWRRRLKGKPDWVDAPTFDLGDDGVGLLIGGLLLALIVPFVLIGVIAVLEAVLLAAVLPFALLGRVLLGRHWVVEARCGWRPWWETTAGSWTDSGVVILETAARIEAGDPPPRTLGAAVT